MTGARGNHRALILAPFAEAQLARLRRRVNVSYESWMETRELRDPDELGARLHEEGCDILVIEVDFVFEEVFEAAPGLGLVGVCRATTSHVDLEAATRHGVLVVNTPGRNAQAVAEHALGLMLSLARRIPEAHAYVKGRRWQNPLEPYLGLRGIELSGRTLGIVGFGTIGRKLASIASAVGMSCIAHDPYVSPPVENARLVELDDLLVESDFVSVHAPLTAETRGLIDERRLGLMKPTAHIVNLSDAAIVDEQALVRALTERRIAGAALDVFETQPIAPDSPLLRLENVILTPHLGGATDETVERHSAMMADDVLRWVDGERPERLVNPEAWAARG